MTKFFKKFNSTIEDLSNNIHIVDIFTFWFWPPFDLYWPLVTSNDLWWKFFSNNWILQLKTFPTISILLTFLHFYFDLHLTFMDLYWPLMTSDEKNFQIIELYNWRPFQQYPYVEYFSCFLVVYNWRVLTTECRNGLWAM